MTRIVMLALSLAAALGAARPARAQSASGSAGAKADAGAVAATPAGAAPARVRASHRVDVIAPGEKIDSVVSRLRAAPDGASAAPAGRGPQRRERPEDRAPAAGRGSMPGAAPGAGAAGPPPAMGGARPGGMAPPDRPHR